MRARGTARLPAGRSHRFAVFGFWFGHGFRLSFVLPQEAAIAQSLPGVYQIVVVCNRWREVTAIGKLIDLRDSISHSMH
jgi:hypothetical protein